MDNPSHPTAEHALLNSVLWISHKAGGGQGVRHRKFLDAGLQGGALMKWTYIFGVGKVYILHVIYVYLIYMSITCYICLFDMSK